MKIGLLSQWYDPETGPAALPGVYAREFARLGHGISVLTGFPNYPEGQIYPGYKMRPKAVEIQGDTKLTRVALYPSHSRSAIGRALNYSSFALSATLLGRSALRDADAIWVYNSPITTALPMLVHSKLGKTPVFLHVQDLWPDSLVDSGMFLEGPVGNAVAKSIASIVRLMERKSAVVGVISKSVRDLIVERNPQVDPSKIVYVPNPTNEYLFRPSRLVRTEHAIKLPTGQINVMYAGAVGDVQGLDTLVEAALLLHSEPHIKFQIVGDGIKKQELESRTKQLGLQNVEFLGRVPQAEVPILMAGAHIHLVSLDSSEFLRYTTPSKIPSLLASEVPIVAQIEGDGARMILDSGAGTVVAPGNAEALAHAVQAVSSMRAADRQRMARNGRRYYEMNLSAESAAKNILNAIEAVR